MLIVLARRFLLTLICSSAICIVIIGLILLLVIINLLLIVAVINLFKRKRNLVRKLIKLISLASQLTNSTVNDVDYVKMSKILLSIECCLKSYFLLN